MIWVAVAGLIITIVALLARSVTVWNRQPFSHLRDTERFRVEYETWEPLVFEQSRTIRSVKRFGNRARFLVADHPEEMVPALVGFVALEELGIYDVSKEGFEFSAWQKQEWIYSDRHRLTERSRSRIRDWMKDIAETDAQIFRLLTKGPPIDPHELGRSRIAYCVGLARLSQSAPRRLVLRPVVAICLGQTVPYGLVLASHNAGLDLLGIYDNDRSAGAFTSGPIRYTDVSEYQWRRFTKEATEPCLMSRYRAKVSS